MPRSIPVTRGLTTLVDDEDYTWLSQYTWHCTHNGYAASRIHLNGGYPYLYMHRLILGARPGQFVDHINGDKLYNTRANLRFVTREQNGWNRKIGPNISGYKGVTWHDHHGKWQARIFPHRRQIFLGYYDDPVEAALAYDAAAELHFGEYARKNFPEPRTELDTEEDGQEKHDHQFPTDPK